MKNIIGLLFSSTLVAQVGLITVDPQSVIVINNQAHAVVDISNIVLPSPISYGYPITSVNSNIASLSSSVINPTSRPDSAIDRVEVYSEAFTGGFSIGSMIQVRDEQDLSLTLPSVGSNFFLYLKEKFIFYPGNNPLGNPQVLSIQLYNDSVAYINPFPFGDPATGHVEVNYSIDNGSTIYSKRINNLNRQYNTIKDGFFEEIIYPTLIGQALSIDIELVVDCTMLRDPHFPMLSSTFRRLGFSMNILPRTSTPTINYFHRGSCSTISVERQMDSQGFGNVELKLLPEVDSFINNTSTNWYPFLLVSSSYFTVPINYDRNECSLFLDMPSSLVLTPQVVFPNRTAYYDIHLPNNLYGNSIYIQAISLNLLGTTDHLMSEVMLIQ